MVFKMLILQALDTFFAILLLNPGQAGSGDENKLFSV
jgi:hypothetical protein